MLHPNTNVIRRAVIMALLVVAAAFLWPIGDELARQIPSWLLRRSPHDDYVRTLRTDGLDRTADGSAWLAAAEHAVEHPVGSAAVVTKAGSFDELQQPSYGWRFHVRRGQRLTIDVGFARGPLFIDLFRSDDHQRIANAAAEATRLTYDVRADGDVIARIQPQLRHTGAFRIVQRADASLGFPVEGVTSRAIGGGFGGPRDEGRRRHEGIDIFAPRGTPVVAATDGWITAQTSNRLGGNVVWLWSLRPRVALYYAHLDRQAVSPGTHVRKGDVLGYVGTTGNARGTSPHLHFGVYAPPDGAVDPLPFVCDAPCGERLMQHRPPRNRSDS